MTDDCVSHGWLTITVLVTITGTPPATLSPTGTLWYKHSGRGQARGALAHAKAAAPRAWPRHQIVPSPRFGATRLRLLPNPHSPSGARASTSTFQPSERRLADLPRRFPGAPAKPKPAAKTPPLLWMGTLPCPRGAGCRTPPVARVARSQSGTAPVSPEHLPDPLGLEFGANKPAPPLPLAIWSPDPQTALAG